MDNLIARAQRLVAARMEERRRAFTPIANTIGSDMAKAGVHSGSAHQQLIRKHCADELHQRVRLLVTSVLEAHDAMSAPPSAALRTASKDWLAKRANVEEEDLERFLCKPNPAFGESGKPDNLLTVAGSEIESAYAEIDNAFDRLQRDRIERALRMVTRIVRTCFSLLHLRPS
jgi:hypothetical protein